MIDDSDHQGADAILITVSFYKRLLVLGSILSCNNDA
jgi:hypothetical protein